MWWPNSRLRSLSWGRSDGVAERGGVKALGAAGGAWGKAKSDDARLWGCNVEWVVERADDEVNG